MKVSTELCATRHRLDMTEKLLKATLNLNKQTTTTTRSGSTLFAQS